MDCKGDAMPNNYNTQKKVRASDKILTSLMMLMKTKDFKSITVSEVCKSAGVSRMAFYRHYQNLEEVLSIHFEERFETFFIEAEQLDLSSSYDTSLLFLQYIKKESNYYETLIRSGHLETIHTYIESFMIYLFRNLDFHYDLEDDDLIYYAKYRAGGFSRFVIGWIESGMTKSPEHMARLLTKFDL